MLQEGIWLSSSPRLHKIGAGWDMILPKANDHNGGGCYHKYNGMDPATDSLDYRAGVYYLAYSLKYDQRYLG